MSIGSENNKNDFQAFLEGSPQKKQSEVTGAEGSQETTPEPTVNETKVKDKVETQSNQTIQEDRSQETQTEEKPKFDMEEALRKIKEDVSDTLKEEYKEEETKNKNSETWKEYFSNEGEYKDFILKKKLKEGGVNYTPEDLNAMSPKDLTIKKLLDEYGSRGMTEDGALRMLAKQYDLDVEDLTSEENSWILAKEAKGASDYFNNKLNAIREGIELPKADVTTHDSTTQKEVNHEEKFKETLKQWESFSTELVKDPNISSIKVKNGDADFEYKLEDSFVKKMPDLIKEYANVMKLDLNGENAEKVINEIHKQYKAENIENIARAMVDNETSRIKEQISRELDNPILNTNEAKTNKTAVTFADWYNNS